MPFLQSMCIDDHWLSRKATCSLSYLLFKNSYLDMSNGLLYKFDPEIVFLIFLSAKKWVISFYCSWHELLLVMS